MPVSRPASHDGPAATPSIVSVDTTALEQLLDALGRARECVERRISDVKRRLGLGPVDYGAQDEIAGPLQRDSSDVVAR